MPVCGEWDLGDPEWAPSRVGVEGGAPEGGRGGTSDHSHKTGRWQRLLASQSPGKARSSLRQGLIGGHARVTPVKIILP